MSTSLAQPSIDWNVIDTVFLDMDGTLLDLNFDNHFWREHVPVRYAERLGLSVAAAKADLLPRYARIEGTLEWYCVDHWSRELGLDIALLKQEVDHLIAVHPHVTDFLEALAAMGKRRVLVTNAHQKAIALKMERTRLAGHLERIICAHDLGTAKEGPGFWARVHAIEPFDLERTLFVDDSPAVLAAARDHGFRWLVMVLKPDSKAPARAAGEFPAIHDFAELLPDMGCDDQTCA
jgi:putative hydrolase of the HAD superfamily